MKTIEEVRDAMKYGGEVFTSEEFKTYAHENSFNPYDGSGYYHDGENETDISVWSDYDIDTTYPYVCWYNK